MANGICIVFAKEKRDWKRLEKGPRAKIGNSKAADLQ